MKSSASWRLLFVMVVLVAASGASCPRRLGQPATQSPVVFQQPPSLEQLVQSLNASTARVQQLQATGAKLQISGVPTSLKTSLALERPRRFRMRAGLGLTGTELDLGSNDQLYWLWAKRNEPPAVLYAQHTDVPSNGLRQVLTVPPDWIIEALGLVELDPSSQISGPIPRGPGRVELRALVQTAHGPMTKAITMDDRTGVVLEQAVFDMAGQLLASAMLSGHTYDMAYQVSLPRRVDIQLPPAGLDFTLEIEDFIVNQLGGDPGQMWSMPQVEGAPPIPLASVARAAGTNGATRTAAAPVGYRNGAEFMPR